jgi:hypothetical protein
MEWRILLAVVFLVILLGSVLSIAYTTTPARRNLPNKEINYNFIYANANANADAEADADAEDPYDLNAGWSGLYGSSFHFFDSSGNYL